MEHRFLRQAFEKGLSLTKKKQELRAVEYLLIHSDLQMIRKYINMGEGEVRIQYNQFSPVQRFRF